ncbi:MAG: hypothetical protein ABGW65_02795 [Marinoscillum sp.]|jgi:hypothetical protein
MFFVTLIASSANISDPFNNFIFVVFPDLLTINCINTFPSIAFSLASFGYFKLS